MYIKRTIKSKLKMLAGQLPIIAILGPRQSGKTTVAQKTFTKHAYVTLEDPATRAFALVDPRRFLESVKNKSGIIIDEA